MDNILTWDRVALISILNVGYNIDFARWIQLNIHIRAFSETNTFPFPCLIQQLCDAAGVSSISEVDHQIKVTGMTNIILIKNAVNSIIIQRIQPPITFIQTYFEGPFILVEPVERKDTCVDIEVGEKRVELVTAIGGEGVAITFPQPRLLLQSLLRYLLFPLTL